ncbi:MAG: GDSL-type esterase/lipase family protein [Bacteroidales bacterium]|nr:GDSL-type esterase/lipase family protein [Bacteroidales bacterium]
MKKLCLIIVLLLPFLLKAQPVKVACVGNSVTFGYGLENPEKESYPVQLQQLLGENYLVKNFGKSGATLLRKGHRPYNEQEEYKNAIAFAGDIVVIHLGLNDTDPRDWPNYGDDFIKDYLTLIQDFRTANPNCKIFVSRMTPIGHNHWRFKSGTRDWYWKIQHCIEVVAEQADCQLIDLQEILYHRPDLFPDALHPTKEGAGIIAQQVYEAITGDFGGLQMPDFYSDNMILQRDIPLTISGKANAGDQISVLLRKPEKRKAKEIQTQQATAEKDGRWSVTLDPTATGTNYTLMIRCLTSTSSVSNEITYKNIAFGEVWLCSGQSNMVFRVDQSIEDEQNEIKAYLATNPDIRLFNEKCNWLTNDYEWPETALDSVNRLMHFTPAKWEMCNGQNTTEFSAVAFQFGKMLSDSLNVPIGLILNAVGGSPAEAWIDRKTLEFEFPDMLYNWKDSDFIQQWVRDRAKKNIAKSANKLQRHPYEPCYLFESGILPLQGCAIKGVIWYQGESNAHNIETHEKLFPLLVQSWRNCFGENLPFYFVQLSSHDRPSWPAFRNSQRLLMNQLENTGMAVCSDFGDKYDVHPRHKKAVGQRLARWALHDLYGFDVIPSGPLFKSIETKDNAIFISFDYAEGLHASDGKALRTFEIAEQEGQFVSANAEVVGNQVKVWNDSIQNPRFVRYGWQPTTDANLVNGDGLPASTFCEHGYKN